MTGYIRPFKPELRVREYEAFRSVYCGLCHTIKRRYGGLWRMTLTYDMSFYALLLMACGGEKCSVKKRRCAAAPFKKRMCACENAALDTAADAGVIFAHEKLRDAVQDSRGFARITNRALLGISARAYKKAAAYEPTLAKRIRECLDDLYDIERQETDSLDRPADAFAKCTAELADERFSDRERQIAREILYHVGRYIYILDAWDDFEDDIAHKRPNPVSLRFGIKEKTDEAGKSVEYTLEQSQARAAASFELSDAEGTYADILKNILYLGLKASANEVFTRKVRKGLGHGSL